MLGVAVGIAGSVSFDETQQFMGRLGSDHGKKWSFCQKVFEQSDNGALIERFIMYAHAVSGTHLAHTFLHVPPCCMPYKLATPTCAC